MTQLRSHCESVSVATKKDNSERGGMTRGCWRVFLAAAGATRFLDFFGGFSGSLARSLVGRCGRGGTVQLFPCARIGRTVVTLLSSKCRTSKIAIIGRLWQIARYVRLSLKMPVSLIHSTWPLILQCIPFSSSL